MIIKGYRIKMLNLPDIIYINESGITRYNGGTEGYILQFNKSLDLGSEYDIITIYGSLSGSASTTDVYSDQYGVGLSSSSSNIKSYVLFKNGSNETVGLIGLPIHEKVHISNVRYVDMFVEVSLPTTKENLVVVYSVYSYLIFKKIKIR